MNERFQTPINFPSISPVLRQEWYDLSLLAEHVEENASKDLGLGEDYPGESKWQSDEYQAQITIKSELNNDNDEVCTIRIIPASEDEDELLYFFNTYEPAYGGKLEIGLYEGDADFPKYITPGPGTEFSDHMRTISKYLKTAPVELSDVPTDNEEWNEIFRSLLIEAAAADGTVRNFARQTFGQHRLALAGVVSYLKSVYELTDREALIAIDILPESVHKNNQQAEQNRRDRRDGRGYY